MGLFAVLLQPFRFAVLFRGTLSARTNLNLHLVLCLLHVLLSRSS